MGWRADTTTLCRSWLYFRSQGLWIRLLLSVPNKDFSGCCTLEGIFLPTERKTKPSYPFLKCEKICYAGKCMFIVSISVIKRAMLFHNTLSCFTTLSTVSKHCQQFHNICQLCHNTLSFFTTLSAVSQHCQLFHNTVSCFTTLSAVSQHCQLLHNTVSYFTILSTVSKHCQQFHNIASCVTILSAVSQRCQQFHNTVRCVTTLSAVSQVTTLSAWIKWNTPSCDLWQTLQRLDKLITTRTQSEVWDNSKNDWCSS
jgi:hypothetical protein